MKSLIAVLALSLALTSGSRAGERVGDAALGAVSGGLVFGPVGLVAGAVVGFTAGPSIAHSWRANRHHPRQRAHTAKRATRVSQVRPRRAAPPPGEVMPAPGTGGPPVQALE